MSLATLKGKGQITLPTDIRRQIQGSKGDSFNFEVVNGKVVMTPERRAPAGEHSQRKRR